MFMSKKDWIKLLKQKQKEEKKISTPIEGVYRKKGGLSVEVEDIKIVFEPNEGIDCCVTTSSPRLPSGTENENFRLMIPNYQAGKWIAEDGDIFCTSYPGYHGEIVSLYLVFGGSVYDASPRYIEDLYRYLGIEMPFDVDIAEGQMVLNPEDWTTIWATAMPVVYHGRNSSGLKPVESGRSILDRSCDTRSYNYY